MRRDWDYVAFADYQSDMRESASTAAAAIEHLRRRAENAERALAEVVLAAGGKVSIVARDLHDPRRVIETEVWRNEADDTIEIRARRTLGQSAR